MAAAAAMPPPLAHCRLAREAAFCASAAAVLALAVAAVATWEVEAPAAVLEVVRAPELEVGVEQVVAAEAEAEVRGAVAATTVRRHVVWAWVWVSEEAAVLGGRVCRPRARWASCSRSHG